jgi:hypothetical protein
MKKFLLFPAFLLFVTTQPARADFWGGDLPLLAQIVTNTLSTLAQLQQQTKMLKDQTQGINDQINRIKTIEKLINPSNWKEWKNPEVALKRLKEIYYTLPPEYRNQKSDAFESEMSKAMALSSQMTDEAHSTFLSGKELERRGADASPAVAEKLTASGVGTLISLEAQSQVAQSQMISLLSQMLAQGVEQESRKVTMTGNSFKSIGESLSGEEKTMSSLVVPLRMEN